MTTTLEGEVRALTLSPDYKPIAGAWADPVPGLREHPGPLAVGTTVWVHASGHWRPAVVEKVTVKGSYVAGTVVHSSPSNPDRLYRKRVQLHWLRLKVEAA